VAQEVLTKGEIKVIDSGTICFLDPSLPPRRKGWRETAGKVAPYRKKGCSQIKRGGSRRRKKTKGSGGRRWTSNKPRDTGARSMFQGVGKKGGSGPWKREQGRGVASDSERRSAEKKGGDIITGKKAGRDWGKY